MAILKETGTVLGFALDFENEVCDIAIEVLSDIQECDESTVYVKWIRLAGKKVPLLYVLFSGPTSEQMPKVHIDASGSVHPAHAICLVSMPSHQPMSREKMRYVIRKGVEEFLLKYNVKGKSYA